MVCFPAVSSGPSQIVRLRSEAKFAFAQEQAITAEASTLSDDHALSAAVGNFYFGGNGIGLFKMLGAALAGTPVNVPEYVKTF